MNRHISIIRGAALTIVCGMLAIACGISNPTQQITEDIATRENPVEKTIPPEVAEAAQSLLGNFSNSLVALMEGVADQSPETWGDAAVWGTIEGMKEALLLEYAIAVAGDDIHSIRSSLDGIISTFKKDFLAARDAKMNGREVEEVVEMRVNAVNNLSRSLASLATS